MTGCRWGELVALRRHRVDPLHGRLQIVEQLVEVEGGYISVGPPKTSAGVRQVSIPPHLLPALVEHMAAYSEQTPDGLLFTGPRRVPDPAQLHRHVVEGQEQGRGRRAAPLPRLAPPRGDAGGRRPRDHNQGPHVPSRPRKRQRGAALPALDRGSRRRSGRRAVGHGRRPGPCRARHRQGHGSDVRHALKGTRRARGDHPPEASTGKRSPNVPLTRRFPPPCTSCPVKWAAAGQSSRPPVSPKGSQMLTCTFMVERVTGIEPA